MAYPAHSLWAIGATDTLTRIDPQTGTVLARVPVPADPSDIIAVGRELFITNTAASELTPLKVTQLPHNTPALR